MYQMHVRSKFLIRDGRNSKGDSQVHSLEAGGPGGTLKLELAIQLKTSVRSSSMDPNLEMICFYTVSKYLKWTRTRISCSDSWVHELACLN